MKSFLQRLALNAAALILALMMVHIALIMLALGLYFALEMWIGRPGALVVSAFIFIAIAGGAVYLLNAPAKKKQVPTTTTQPTSDSLGAAVTAEAENFVRRHPVGTLSASFLTGFLAARNPSFLGRLMKGLMSLGWMRAGLG